MDPALTESLSAILRWLHVIAAMAWIGSSFYFIHLDLGLRPRKDLPEGVKGEAWQVHGGGFYHMVKYLVAPSRMPEELTWFKWEAYTTWLSGFSLLVVVYYLHAELHLVDTAILDLSPLAAGAISLGGLTLAWLFYEAMCRSRFGDQALRLAIGGYLFLVALTYVFTHTLSGRGAFTQIGALVGTIMIANVFVVIIPNQKKTVAALRAGQEPDPAWGRQAGQRSLHNNYLTLPVVFLMVSSHYPLFFATRYNWVIVAIVLALGPVIRHFFNMRHAGKGSPHWPWFVAAVGVVAIILLSLAGPREEPETGAAAPAAVEFAAAEEIVMTRCSMCHARTPVWDGIAAAPNGVHLDTPAEIRRHADLIELNAVRSRAMPPGNITQITREERATLAAWLHARRDTR